MSARRCVRCQTGYEGDARFCPRCGSPLIEVRAGTATDPAAKESKTAVRKPVKLAPGPTLDNAATLSGFILDSRYQILRRLGEGGMSYVYEARDVSTGNVVAVKVLSPKLARDQSAVERLRREAGLAMRLNHENACPILRLGETEEGFIYLVMPYLDGELLSDREVKVGPMAAELGIDLLLQMCAGLDHAHGLHIIHRDLKPENVMLVRRPNGVDRAVVMDFGLAKDKSMGNGVQKLTATGIVLGTPEFMSPEQVRGKELDPRSDVYALAIVAFEMFTTKLPFEGRGPQEMMVARLRGSPILLRKHRPDLPVKLEKVLFRAMQSDPDDRYANMKEFSAALREAIQEDNSGGMFNRLKKTRK